MNLANPLPETTRHYGTVVYIHGYTLVTSDDAGLQRFLTIAEDAEITCHVKVCKLSDLTVGTIVRVFVRLEDDVVTLVECLRTAPPSETK
jgi:hypothetical protein